MSGRAGRTTAIYFASQVANSLAGFVATWVIANQLGGDILGEYAAVVALLFFLNVPSSSVGSAVNKRISEGGDRAAYVTASHAIVAVTTLAFALSIFLARDLVTQYVGHDIAMALIVLVAANAVYDVALDSLRGAKLVGRSGWLKTGEQVMRTVFQVAVILASAGFVWLVLGHAASLFLAAVLGLWMLDLPVALPERRHFDRLLVFVKYSWLGTVKRRAFAYMDTFVMSAFAGFAPVGMAVVTRQQIGIYTAAWSIASVLGLLSISIRQTLFPELSDLSASGETERVRHFVNEGLAFTGLFVIPGLFGAAIVGGDLLALYRQSFRPGKWILVILVGARLVSAYGSQLIGAINAVDRPDVAFRINAVFLTVNLVGNVALVALYGWYGAAIATALSGTLTFLASAYALSNLIGGLDVPSREIGRQVLAGIGMFAVVFGLDRVVPPGRFFAIGLVGVGAVVYLGAVYALSPRVRGKVQSFVPAR